MARPNAKSARSIILSLGVGDTCSFPIDKIGSIRATCNLIKLSHSRQYATASQTSSGIVTVTRTA